MEQPEHLSAVVKALQNILSTPDLAISQSLLPSNEHASNFPVLPQNIPPLVTPNIDYRLPSLPAHQQQADTSLSRLTNHLATSILPYLNRASLSPNYYGFVIGGATPAALLGDFLASISDQNAHVHLPHETLATTLEVAALNMLLQLFRLPAVEWSIGKKESSGGGTFTTGATASNVLGLALGREFVLQRRLQKLGLKVENETDLSCGEVGIAELMVQAGVKKIQVLSTLPHSSIAKAAGVIGIGRRNVISLSTPGDPLQIDLEKLKTEAEKKEVLNILAISAGEVNTGRFATNSLGQWTSLRKLCDEHGIWIHVDGAFGLFGRLFSPTDDTSNEYTHIIRGTQGIEFADSITGDCHKLLNVPYDCGVFFTRHKSLSEDVFRNGNAAYLTSGTSSSSSSASGSFDDGYGAIQTPLNIGIENSRRFRALPVYSTLIAYGRSGYIDMLTRQISLARRVTKFLIRHPKYEVLPVPGKGETEEDILAKTFIVVLLRVMDEKVMKGFVKSINQTGKIYISGTVWEGRMAARIAVSNWQVDVERDGRLIENVLDEVAGGK